jgi:hypothetical protein
VAIYKKSDDLEDGLMCGGIKGVGDLFEVIFVVNLGAVLSDCWIRFSCD